MFVRIDHVMICVPDLAQGIAQYRRLGFDMVPGGEHPGKGTHIAIAFNGEDYVELLAIRDRAEYLAGRTPGHWSVALDEFVAAGGGIRFVVLQSGALAADVTAMRARGVDVGDAAAGSRRTPQGGELRWKSAVPGPGTPLPVFFIEHLTPVGERRLQVPAAGRHPNGVRAIEAVCIVATDLSAAAERYARVLGVEVPAARRSVAFGAQAAVFRLAEGCLIVAQPDGPGHAAEWLARRGPGVSAAIYRTRSLAAVERHLRGEGLTPPPRGASDDGEPLLLVPPVDACGTVLGFVGPE